MCIVVSGAAELILTSQPQTSGTFCPGPVTFTCVGTQIGAGLFWEVNGATLVSYGFRVTDTFPQTLMMEHPLEGVVAMVTSASINPPGASTIDITSVLSVRDVSVLNGAYLQCAEAAVQASISRIEVDSIRCTYV